MNLNKKDQLLFLPLGGSSEIGMNLNLYQYKGKWLMLDFGAGFADDWLPGVDMIAPDIQFIHENRDKFLGIVLTHAHEDHLGALPYLWGQLQCPVWATPYTAAIARSKMKETDFYSEFNKKLTIVKTGSDIKIDPFIIDLVQLTHSIPEMNAAVIKTEFGNILHTGDWKLDPDPVIPPTTDEARLIAYGKEGVLAMVCDSTNVLSEGVSGSEGDLREHLGKIIAEAKGTVIVTTFASNVARVETIARLAAENGRSIALAGRSFWTYTTAAKECGYLKDIKFLSDYEIKNHPRDKMLVLCTGCQGESRAAMSKVINHTHPTVRLKPDDTVIFSSKVIPGNEKKIFRMFNQLVKSGAEVFTEKDHYVHVSGHPKREEMRRMYEMVKPKISIPVHGEPVHLHEHVKFARAQGVPYQIEVTNGEVVRIAPGEPQSLGHVQSGYYAVDGSRLLSPDSQVMKARRRMISDGMVFISLVLTKKGGLVDKPYISAPGLLDAKENRRLLEEISEGLIDLIEDQRNLSNDNIYKKIKTAIRRIFMAEIGKKPSNIEINIVRV